MIDEKLLKRRDSLVTMAERGSENEREIAATKLERLYARNPGLKSASRTPTPDLQGVGTIVVQAPQHWVGAIQKAAIMYSDDVGFTLDAQGALVISVPNSIGAELANYLNGVMGVLRKRDVLMALHNSVRDPMNRWDDCC